MRVWAADSIGRKKKNNTTEELCPRRALEKGQSSCSQQLGGNLAVLLNTCRAAAELRLPVLWSYLRGEICPGLVKVKNGMWKWKHLEGIFMKLLKSLIDKDRGGCGFIGCFSHNAIRIVSCGQILIEICIRQMMKHKHLPNFWLKKSICCGVCMETSHNHFETRSKVEQSLPI